jgi:excisionase family DNA binding protein
MERKTYRHAQAGCQLTESSPRSRRPPPRLLTRQQVADHLAVSTKTVTRWNESGALPMHRLGRQVRVSEDDLIAFTAARRR